MKKHIGRFSVYIRPFSYCLDLFIINSLAYALLLQVLNGIYYHVFLSFSWIVISWNVGFYEVYRFTKVSEIFEKIVKQYLVFIIINFAYIGYFIKFSEPSIIVKFITLATIFIAFCKLFIYYFLRKIRVVFGGNFRKVVIVGSETGTKQLSDFFNENPNYGYKLVKTFNINNNRKDIINQCFEFVLRNKIDEIYCVLNDLTTTDIDNFIDFTDNNLKTLKFIPGDNEVQVRNFKQVYYGYIPIFSLRNIPLDILENKIIKRIFDLLFSIFVIVVVLSWLTPLLAILIKIESRGPIFFIQKRNGLNYHEFDCYKFRSMAINEKAHLEQVSKNDPRITKIGKIIRKTSIDELPQFFNVFLGHMSVVGPRPHMVSHTEMYAKKVDKFMVRHFIKPGITGLAQTKGYRGEVETEKDIINRVKYDIYYLENWSLILDVKIVFMTVINAIKGEEKAY
ncbi:exopolysaccharide biosynthesis polyprenyl glycosylphosphotransferase [Flavobacterium aciduliphilum]|uniref:Putative colanic acid biosynthesis UDP-glucose lipid carrier transferase n=1 Tax=Flavobacterium aciduliphilum TaxID=1101402 RepID=A0A328YFW1_9FLAO|nr:exopolysaccharide biosynthesis polyprenyl glycosylphosphotransferase [Flavobacterium aciduliphilum]RAR72908.1 putative colanic acid biosynthesis UDP-glucose lipid carrier transferase [Flavobacterium aciduliphilum]